MANEIEPSPSKPSSNSQQLGRRERASASNRKLFHLVQRFVSISASTTSPNVDYIVHCIRTQHAEYQRKSLEHFKKKVKRAVKEVLAAAKQQQIEQQQHQQEQLSRISGGKRKYESNSDVSSNGSEKGPSRNKIDRNQPLVIESRKDLTINGMLSDNYRRVQQERDAVATAAAAAAARAAAAAAASPNSDVDISQNQSSSKTRILKLESVDAENSGLKSSKQSRTPKPFSERENERDKEKGNDEDKSINRDDNRDSDRDNERDRDKGERGISKHELKKTTTFLNNDGNNNRKDNEGPVAAAIAAAAAAVTDVAAASVDISDMKMNKNHESSTEVVSDMENMKNTKESNASNSSPDLDRDRDKDESNEEKKTRDEEKIKGSDKEKEKDKDKDKKRTSKHKMRKLMKQKSTTSLAANDATPHLSGNDPSPPQFLSPSQRPWERYEDLGGIDKVLQQIRETVEYPLLRPELYRHLGVDAPRGVLLRGPPGCGKTHLANAIAGQLGVSFFRVSAPELVSGVSGESEGRIRDLFRIATDLAPSIIFMDEIDAIAPKRNESGSSRGMEKRMVAQLLTSMDMLSPKYTRKNAPVMVLAATNQPDALDPALRRAGRFDKEILLGVPDEEDREKILRTMMSGILLSGGIDLRVLARKTPGYVGADILSLIKEAAHKAIKRVMGDNIGKRCREQEQQENNEQEGLLVSWQEKATMEEESFGNGKDSKEELSPEELQSLSLTMEDFLSAIPLVQPSCKREGFAMIPDVSWDDIGALKEVRAELTLSVLEPIQHPEKFKALGIPLPTGVLLYGPPGCGKTLLAKAIASESGANFISVKGPELLDKYVGESERAVRRVFDRARNSSPCIVFFDELDSLCPKRGSDGGNSGVSERVVNQLLTEMDGLDTRRNVFVMGATNRPELIDPAMMRPGRLDKLLYVPLPKPEDRVSILEAASKNMNLSDDVQLGLVGRSPRAVGYSGADCAALLREAGLEALKEHVTGDVTELCIASRHFDRAFNNVLPSVGRKDQARYDRMRKRIASARTFGGMTDTGAEESADLVDPVGKGSEVKEACKVEKAEALKNSDVPKDRGSVDKAGS